jgi:hypothetical protein
MASVPAPVDVTIIGGGWSVLNLPLDVLCGRVIAVNDSAIHAPRWDVAVSMDRLWTEHRLNELIIRSAEVEPRREIWLRRSAVQNLKVDGWPWVHVFECDHKSNTFSTKPKTLNGTNSGACALNLAWQMRPARVFLLGFDMCRAPDGRAYWYPPYPWSNGNGGTSNGKYASWAGQFKAARSAFQRIGCKVFNVSPASAIEDFPKLTPAQYVRECR